MINITPTFMEGNCPALTPLYYSICLHLILCPPCPLFLFSLSIIFLMSHVSFSLMSPCPGPCLVQCQCSHMCFVFCFRFCVCVLWPLCIIVRIYIFNVTFHISLSRDNRWKLANGYNLTYLHMYMFINMYCPYQINK